MSKKISETAASIIIDCLQILENKKEVFVPQDDSKATYAKKIEKSEAKINWKDSKRFIEDFTQWKRIIKSEAKKKLN